MPFNQGGSDAVVRRRQKGPLQADAAGGAGCAVGVDDARGVRHVGQNVKWFPFFRKKAGDIGSPLMSPSFTAAPAKVVPEPPKAPVLRIQPPPMELCSECDAEWAPATVMGPHRRLVDRCSICGDAHSRPTPTTKKVREETIRRMMVALEKMTEDVREL